MGVGCRPSPSGPNPTAHSGPRLWPPAITKGRHAMLSVSGGFSGSIRTQSVVAVADQLNHSIGVVEVSGTQSSSDPKWNNARVTYWGTTDMQGTRGVQRGYFVNDH